MTRTRLLDRRERGRAAVAPAEAAPDDELLPAVPGHDPPVPELHHHTLVVGEDYRGFIRDVTQRRRIPDHLSLYLHAPSRTEPAMAAPGGESIYVLLPVPNLRSGDDWAVRGPELRDRVVRFLEHDSGWTGCRRRSRWSTASPRPISRRELGAADGNAFAIEPTLLQSAYFRQPNRDRTVGGLYYVGAGTHPGGGIPGVLLTAEVTGELIRADGAAGRIVRPTAPRAVPVAGRGTDVEAA